MTDRDLDVVERYVVDLWRPTKRAPRPPVARSEEFDRIEIDLSKWKNPEDAIALQDCLAQTMGRNGYDWDCWFLPVGELPNYSTLCVSYKETEEEVP
jgi:hypothetical protein